MFSDSDSEEGGDNFQLTINDHYAKAFEYKKEREELEKLKEKYGSDAEEDEGEESDSESDEYEDEDGEELTPAVDAAILRTLARIKRKDPEIYNSKSGIFEEEQQKVGPMKSKSKPAKGKSKPVTIRQVALEAALDTGSRSPSPEPHPLTHVEEQERLRDETIAAFRGNDDDDEGDDFLVPREKTKDEQEKEEEEYRSFLERNVGTDIKELVTVDPDAISWEGEGSAGTSEAVGDDGRKKKKKSKEVKKEKKRSKEEADHEFLMSYIMNRGWIDQSSKRVPTYKEITASKEISRKGKGKAESEEEEISDRENDVQPTNDADVDSDDFDEIVDRFESSYNFRFEEPDADVIKQYPRQIESTVRREDSTRKEARKRKAARKEEELQNRREEVKRLKALKMKELRAKLDKIGREGGRDFQDDDPALQELDLEGDWDPEAHDRQMGGLYGDDAEYDDDEKPTWDDDIDIGDIYVSGEEQPAESSKKEKKKKKKKKGEVQEDGVDLDDMDADVEKMGDDEEWDGTEEMRKRKLDEYMDEIYGLEFNDMVGGMPTRFKYAKVKPEAFALTPVEILLANDKELNEYMSIKKYAPYRQDGKWDNTRNERLQELKAKIAQRRGDDRAGPAGADNADRDYRPAKKRKGKKERMKMKILAEPENTDVIMEDEQVISKEGTSAKRPRDEGDHENEGEKPRKKKRSRHKKDKKDVTVS
ncbi:Kinetochore protein Spc24 [Marasmius crinis-equi]|uniref:Kinetochore protein Spc24 n=1 Tax=Marasmius crinis-equi TaxID=585013 RepID=A0ABR3FHZ8_9AGAR